MGMASLVKSRTRGDMIATFYHLRDCLREVRDSLFSKTPEDQTRNNG